MDLLIVDDDPEFRETVVRRFRRRGVHVEEASNGEAALGLSQRRAFHVALVDLVMPGMSGVELLKKLKADFPDIAVVLLTGQGSIESAVEAMKLGALDYLSKPCPLAELEAVIEKAAQQNALTRENRQLKAVLAKQASSYEMIGQSPMMLEVYRLIERAGPTDKAILIQGESGTGKELVARALHKSSHRADKPLVVINCAALPETLLESELFGHEKGSFTGASSQKLGLFEVADGGTLMIDEIGEMPGSLQAKLLRVLEDGSFRRIGSLAERRVDVRLLAATNRNMADEVASGRFREDLYYRINVMSLYLPTLREREGDIRLLIEKFLGDSWRISSEARQAMERYSWPGNVRQLINAIDRAKILADDKTIQLRDLPAEVAGGRAGDAVQFNSDALSSIQRSHIVEVLRREGGNKARTARVLGVNRRSLYRLLEKYEIPTVSKVGANGRQ